MKKLSLLLSLAFLLTLSGCVISIGDGENSGWENNWEETQRHNREVIARLNIGDSLDVVLDSLGKPAFSESFTQGEKTYQVYYFRTHRAHGDGDTTKDETTPVLFLEGKLKGWGQSALDSVMNIHSPS
ncbi:MAG: hypothetical protein COW84_03390 [Gammaproteobacteria bacterium CG22_combo_CG10-13_8_21_14_all_40_8]|nr:MAG: hypothetical protein COW84_03390 [Gammaproteobacteria bacterium CG22_combo_CG10-13_8_21_14_all_40_8]